MVGRDRASSAMAEPSASSSQDGITEESQIAIIDLKAEPVELKCPQCNMIGKTEIIYVNGSLSWITCLIMLWFGLILGCFLLPFCVKGCKDCVHKCSSCGHVFGKYRRLSSDNIPS
ncbi:hypothetical protein FSP39_014995 [Pinctada imbricata]|uniref:LITAF domain-containing protein n=1 Tax=Pinctada imbricata TaxID=66713 RepID=A0AA88XV08_PINIB|nr:hypothetical protein FSP39_014995 [Pinctada imbricata]